MKLATSNTNPLGPLLESIPTIEHWVTRADLEVYTLFFASAGWICENDYDVYTILKFMAEEEVIEVELDHKQRVRKIKRICPL